jgi:HD-GYP domain-containing protein (c-di-GMP phosphodiesterase class II)
VGIAEMVNRLTTGKLKGVHFDENQLKEIRYAGLLHDFGKVGVREHVLLKAKKLYPDHLELVKRRFDIARQIYRKETNRSKVELLLAQGREEYLRQFKHIDGEMHRHLEALDRYLAMIVGANEPTVLDKDDFSILEGIARIVVSDPEENNFPLLSSKEYQILSIPKGSLTPDERLEIESHVTHTFNFLTKIPWTGELQDIPEIAYGHHEKLDGSGYPRGINADNICVQTRMMTISDIYDALTATDRPYKPAVPTERALDILGHEVREGKIDPDLFNVFVEAKVFNLVKGKHS